MEFWNIGNIQLFLHLVVINLINKYRVIPSYIHLHLTVEAHSINLRNLIYFVSN